MLRLLKNKISSWKEYCTLTSSANPWNEVYKIAAGKREKNMQLTILRKPNGSLMKDTSETLQHMLEYFVAEDKLTDDNDHHTKPDYNPKHLWIQLITKNLP